MFPPFVDSFGAQFNAVLINMFGTVTATLVGSILSAFVTSFITPFFKSIAEALGLSV